jgi:hypothetical protein
MPCSLGLGRAGTSNVRSAHTVSAYLIPVMVCGCELASDGATSGGRVAILDNTLTVLIQRADRANKTDPLTSGGALHLHS